MNDDRRRLLAAAFLRSLAVGAAAVAMGLLLAGMGLDQGAAGTVVAAGLAGLALGTGAATYAAPRLGTRRVLLAAAGLSAAGTAAFALVRDPRLLALAAFLGMLNGMGRDRGPALVLEQALLPGTTDDAGRTKAFAWQSVLQDAGHALGAACGALPTLLIALFPVDESTALRVLLLLTALLQLATAAVYLRLGALASGPVPAPPGRVSPATRRILWRISALFALDSVGGGFLTTALLGWFFTRRFGASAAAVGALFAAARVLNALSHLAAAWLARRIGLVNTMVFTHLPSSLLLLTVGFAPSFAVAAILFLLREGLVEMDVPTRQSYVMALVRPEERAVASGVTNLVRLAGWAAAPALVGTLGSLGSGLPLLAPLAAGAGLKIAYDLLLWRAFRKLRPPEELA